MRPRAFLVFLALALALSGCDPHPVFLAQQPTSPSHGPNAEPSDPSDDPQKEPGAAPPGPLPQVVNHGLRTSNTVALTFDADMTPGMLARLNSGRVDSYANVKVLDILDARDIPATFFITGMWAEQYPSLAQRIADDPNWEVGNHTYRHSAFLPNCHGLPTLPPAQMTSDVSQTFDVLRRFHGHQTRFFRFPGLCHNAVALKALAPLGVTVIDGDCISGDPFATAAEPIVHRVLSTVQPGSIIVMHITQANARFTDQALGPILDGLAQRGLRPVKLSELLAPAPR